MTNIQTETKTDAQAYVIVNTSTGRIESRHGSEKLARRQLSKWQKGYSVNGQHISPSRDAELLEVREAQA